MFKGISQCISTVDILYVGPFNPFHYSPLPLYLFPSIFQKFSMHTLISSTFTFYILQYYWCSIILFPFPSFPKVHRVVPLLQTCSTYEFVYEHTCFCIYVYLLDLFSMHEENMWSLSFWAWLTSLNITSSNCIHFPSNHLSLCLMAV
jgi:hypothetical protein